MKVVLLILGIVFALSFGVAASLSVGWAGANEEAWWAAAVSFWGIMLTMAGLVGALACCVILAYTIDDSNW